jgi:hypothetical protein
MGSNDFIIQKVYLLRLMPVYVGLSMVSCLFLLVGSESAGSCIRLAVSQVVFTDVQKQSGGTSKKV